MKNMVYIQSGGPTSVINSSFYGAIQEAKRHSGEIDKIYGSLHGIEGLIYDDLIDISAEDDDQLALLLQTPGSILGTTRRKLPKDIHDPVYGEIIDNLVKHEIKYVFVNGGNDSMDTCYKISLLVKERGLDIVVVGVPKTIDNDLAITDHSLGFPSAAKYVINTFQALANDASCFMKGKVHIVEVMGRNAGWLTAAPDLLSEGNRPHLFYLPENKFDLDQFCKDVKEVYEREGYALVSVSEGVEFERLQASTRLDGFGHAQLGGAAADLCKIIEDKFDLPTRAVELSLMQRACPAYISKVDSDEAVRVGNEAVKAALAGKTGNMVILKRVSDKPYEIKYELAPLDSIANEVSQIPQDMMCDKTKMSQKFRDYLAPLIVGEAPVKYENGIALTPKLKRIKVK